VNGFRAAFVCTGNRFRSPLAAGVFRRELQEGGWGADVESFGVLDVASAPALGEALELGEAFGVDLTAHRARQLPPHGLTGFDLVVGFERFHLATAVVDGGARRDATYTLPELVTLLGRISQDGAKSRLASAAGARDAGKTFAGVPEIADPLGRPPRVQREIATQVVELTRELTRLLFEG
jgi:protein-tyrosine-phosphatase